MKPAVCGRSSPTLGSSRTERCHVCNSSCKSFFGGLTSEILQSTQDSSWKHGQLQHVIHWIPAMRGQDGCVTVCAFNIAAGYCGLRLTESVTVHQQRLASARQHSLLLLEATIFQASWSIRKSSTIEINGTGPKRNTGDIFCTMCMPKNTSLTEIYNGYALLMHCGKAAK